MSLLTNPESQAPTQSSGSRMWWVLLGAVATAQLCAFWLVCSQQVRKAEARHNEAVVEQMALSDCLQYIPGSTIASCTSRLDTQAPSQPADNPAMTGAVPVSFSFR